MLSARYFPKLYVVFSPGFAQTLLHIPSITVFQYDADGPVTGLKAASTICS
jgi:hypothetical protein